MPPPGAPQVPGAPASRCPTQQPFISPVPTPRVPLDPDVVLDGMRLSPPTADAADALRDVRASGEPLQDFRPLTECLEWELSDRLWNREGLLPFVEDDVPYLINNSGRLSAHCAAVLLASCIESPPAGPIRVLELGAGTGLFARLFLDAFRTQCERAGHDFHERLVYHVTDGSAQTVAHWRERHQFDAHQGVRPGVCDALRPSQLHLEDGTSEELYGLRAVFCNYILDSLPATVLRNGPAGPEQLLIRTHLVEDASVIGQYTTLDREAILALARSGEAADRDRLLPFISLLEFETKFDPIAQPDDFVTEALAGVAPGERVMLNHGAYRSVEACLALLEADGFLLVNDFGPVEGEQAAGHGMSQRFGRTSALSINFPLLERHFGGSHLFIAPEGDDHRGIHTRLVTRSAHPATAAALQDRLGTRGAGHYEGPLEEARQHVSAGRRAEALDAWRVALARNPHDWHIRGEAAEFVGLTLQDTAAARELAREALQLNPWYSPWLWNVLGDIQFLDRDIRGAHEAYLQAWRIHPADGRTNLNLSFTHFEFGEYREALEALARAFAADVRGTLRPRLLEKQHQVLGAIGTRWLGEQERLARRIERLRA